jgi:putative flippase GtrA
LIPTSTDGKSIVAGYLNYRLLLELGIRQGQLKFALSSLVGLSLNTFFAWYVVDVLGESKYISALLMVGITPFVIFLLNKLFVFRHAS